MSVERVNYENKINTVATDSQNLRDRRRQKEAYSKYEKQEKNAEATLGNNLKNPGRFNNYAPVDRNLENSPAVDVQLSTKGRAKQLEAMKNREAESLQNDNINNTKEEQKESEEDNSILGFVNRIFDKIRSFRLPFHGVTSSAEQFIIKMKEFFHMLLEESEEKEEMSFPQELEKKMEEKVFDDDFEVNTIDGNVNFVSDGENINSNKNNLQKSGMQRKNDIVESKIDIRI